jgi:hypothetical protein
MASAMVSPLGGAANQFSIYLWIGIDPSALDHGLGLFTLSPRRAEGVPRFSIQRIPLQGPQWENLFRIDPKLNFSDGP